MQNDWFTVEPIDDDTFAIGEYRHWEEPHSYLLCGTERAALIDTGLGVSDLRAVVSGLTDRPVTVLTTHAHWDHIGGHRQFDRIAVHENERAWLSGAFPLPDREVLQNLMRDPCAFPAAFDPDRYGVYRGGAQTVLHDGDRIDLGGRTVTAVHTPGHSPGHCCFYEADRRYLFAGDLIYAGRLDAFYPSTDPQQFFASVRRVGALAVDKVLPGHHRLDIPVSLIGEIGDAFASIERNGRLHHGGGTFDFGTFRIRL